MQIKIYALKHNLKKIISQIYTSLLTVLFKDVSYRQFRVLLSLSVYNCCVLGVENLASQQSIYRPHYFAHVHVALLLRTILEVAHRVKAQQVETHTVGHYLLASHLLTLLFGIEATVWLKVLA